MARLFISRMLELFFRRRLLFLAPVVVLGVLGVASVLMAGTSYRSAGVILVNRDTLLSEITDSNASNDGFGTDTPSTYISRQISTLLQTDQFLGNVVENAGLTEAVETGAITSADIRKAVQAAVAGDDLVGIIADSDNPELSYRLAQATIDAYLGWQIENRQTDSAAAVQELESQVEQQKELIESGGTAGLTATALDAAEEQLAALEAQLGAARRAGDQSPTDINQRFRVIDAPEQPDAPQSSRAADIQSVMMFVILGAIVSGGALVLLTLLDRSVRYPEEIESRLHLPVLATVPDSPTARTPRLT